MMLWNKIDLMNLKILAEGRSDSKHAKLLHITESLHKRKHNVLSKGEYILMRYSNQTSMN